jgi:hypothetical protein
MHLIMYLKNLKGRMLNIVNSIININIVNLLLL